MRPIRLTARTAFLLVAVLCLVMSPTVGAQMKGTKITAYVDGEKLLEHTFEESMYIPGKIIFVPYNGVVRFDDVKVTSLSGEVLFADDFTDETPGAFPSRWERGNAGGWTIVTEGDNKVLEQSDDTVTGMSDLWPNVSLLAGLVEHTLEFKYKLVSWNGSTYRMNFFPRGNDRNNGYMIQYHERDKVLSIAHRASGGDNRTVETPFEFEPDRWYSFRLEVALVD